MLQARITRKEGYRCAPRGSVVEVFPFGVVVTGRAAECALEDHAAARVFDPREETKPAAPVETKAKRGRPRKKAE